MAHSYDTPNTSSKMEMLHFWCVLFGCASGATPNSSIRLFVCRSTTHSTVSTGISSLAIRHTSPPDSPSSTSVTTSPFLPSYHLETSNAKTLMPSFPSYIPSEISSPLFISLLIEAYLLFRNFEEYDLSYEEWKSALHLSTRWGFASIRKLALGSIKPPTPHDRLRLARTYSIDDWVVPALSELCERTTPLTLPEARQMSIEDVVLVSTVREDIRSQALQVDSAEIPLRIEAEQLGTLGLEIPSHLRCSERETSSTVDRKRVSTHEGDDKHSVSPSCSPFWGVSGQ